MLGLVWGHFIHRYIAAFVWTATCGCVASTCHRDQRAAVCSIQAQTCWCFLQSHLETTFSPSVSSWHCCVGLLGGMTTPLCCKQDWLWCSLKDMEADAGMGCTPQNSVNEQQDQSPPDPWPPGTTWRNSELLHGSGICRLKRNSAASKKFTNSAFYVKA